MIFFYFHFFSEPAYASRGLQLPAGAEARHVSVGAEGSHRAGAGPGGAEPAVCLPAGYAPAAILTCHTCYLCPHLSTTSRSRPRPRGRRLRPRRGQPSGKGTRPDFRDMKFLFWSYYRRRLYCQALKSKMTLLTMSYQINYFLRSIMNK